MGLAPNMEKHLTDLGDISISLLAQQLSIQKSSPKAQACPAYLFGNVGNWQDPTTPGFSEYSLRSGTGPLPFLLNTLGTAQWRASGSTREWRWWLLVQALSLKWGRR